MALKDQPYLPLFIQDLLTDEKLIECSPEAHGVYFRLMCILHKQNVYGKIELKAKYKQISSKMEAFALMLSKQMPFTKDEIDNGIGELKLEGVIQINGDILSQKRMVRDGEASLKKAFAGSLGGKAESKTQANGKQNRSKQQANTESAIESESIIKGEKEIFKNVPIPKVLDNPDCIKALIKYFQWRDETLGKPLQSIIEIETFLEELKKVCFGNPQTAIEIMKKSIIGKYPGVYELKTNSGKKEDPIKPRVSAKKGFKIDECPHCHIIDGFMEISKSDKGAIMGCNNCKKEFEVKK